MAFNEDLSLFFRPNNPGVKPATYNGGIVYGQFWNEFVEVGQVEGAAPRFVCREADVAGVAHGSVLVIDSTTYKVVRHKPDGTGVIDLKLEKQ